MTRAEMMQFLGLPEAADNKQAASRYKEKYNFFHTLFTNAPNDTIRNIQQKNLDILEQIRLAFFPKGFDTAGNIRTPAAQPQSPPAAANRQHTPAPDKEPLAWLVVHTEYRPRHTYPLLPGENIIGRIPAGTGHSIVISDDPFISRSHCIILLAPAYGEMSAAVIDDGRRSGGNPSKNGCYVNGNPDRITMHKLQENDTLQVGMTKLVFRWNSNNRDNVADEVGKTDYVKSIVIEI